MLSGVNHQGQRPGSLIIHEAVKCCLWGQDKSLPPRDLSLLWKPAPRMLSSSQSMPRNYGRLNAAAAACAAVHCKYSDGGLRSAGGGPDQAPPPGNRPTTGTAALSAAKRLGVGGCIMMMMMMMMVVRECVPGVLQGALLADLSKRHSGCGSLIAGREAGAHHPVPWIDMPGEGGVCVGGGLSVGDALIHTRPQQADLSTNRVVPVPALGGCRRAKSCLRASEKGSLDPDPDQSPKLSRSSSYSSLTRYMPCSWA